MTSPVRVSVQDAHGQPRADWVHTKPDHLFHASVYDTVARRLLPPDMPDVLPFGVSGTSFWSG